MKQSLSLLLIFFSLNIFGQNYSNYVPNTLIVKFKKIGRGSKKSTSSVEISSLKIKSASIDQVKQLFPRQSERASSGTSLSSASSFDTSDLNRIVEINYSPNAGVDIKEIEAEILKNPNVEYVDRRYIYHTYATPNDPGYVGNMQSYLSQVHVPEAWNVPLDATNPIVIAIVDSGSQLNHEDLAANIYPGGYDLVGCCRDSPTPDDDPNVYSIDATHGVHVSGLASAVTNNGKGIASIAYNNAKLLIVKVSGDDFPKEVVKGYEGIVYAVEKGAKIINCSWGGDDPGPYGQNIINYAIRNDCLVVAAAGNGNPNTGIGYPSVDYPAAYPGVLAVASVSNSDTKSRFSNYGSQVSISAPGENILSTLYNNAYGNDSGTSMATPLVSSAAAFVKMVYPSLTMHQVGERLKATADNIDAKNPNYVGLLGTGTLNVDRALTNTVPTLDAVRLMQNYPNPSSDHTYIDFSIPSDGQTSLMLYSIFGQPVKELVNAYLNKGPYHIPVYLGDLSAGIYIYMLRYGSTERALKLLVAK